MASRPHLHHRPHNYMTRREHCRPCLPAPSSPTMPVKPAKAPPRRLQALPLRALPRKLLQPLPSKSGKRSRPASCSARTWWCRCCRHGACRRQIPTATATPTVSYGCGAVLAACTRVECATGCACRIVSAAICSVGCIEDTLCGACWRCGVRMQPTLPAGTALLHTQVGGHKASSKTELKTLEPRWNETFVFRAADVATALEGESWLGAVHSPVRLAPDGTCRCHASPPPCPMQPRAATSPSQPAHPSPMCPHACVPI